MAVGAIARWVLPEMWGALGTVAIFPLAVVIFWEDAPKPAVLAAWVVGGAFVLYLHLRGMRFTCPYCGKGLKSGAGVCHHCGRDVYGPPAE